MKLPIAPATRSGPLSARGIYFGWLGWWRRTRMPFRLIDNMRLVTTASWSALSSRNNHGFAVSSARTALITTRVRFIAALFSVLSLCWIGIDIAAFPAAVALPLTGARVATAIAF